MKKKRKCQFTLIPGRYQLKYTANFFFFFFCWGEGASIFVLNLEEGLLVCLVFLFVFFIVFLSCIEEINAFTYLKTLSFYIYNSILLPGSQKKKCPLCQENFKSECLFIVILYQANPCDL